MNLNDPNSIDSGIPDGGMTDDVTVPLGVSGFEGEVNADLGLGSSPRRLKSGSVLLAAVVVLSVGGLFLMKTLGTASANFAGNAAIEAIINEFLNPAGQDPLTLLAQSDSEALEVLNETYTQRQVPLVNVQKNPFILYEVPQQAVDRPDTVRLEWERQREVQRARFEQASTQLQLKSVLLGSTPLANISGKIVREGETVMASREEVMFRVTVIEDGYVELVAIDEEFELEVKAALAIER